MGDLLRSPPELLDVDWVNGPAGRALLAPAVTGYGSAHDLAALWAWWDGDGAVERLGRMLRDRSVQGVCTGYDHVLDREVAWGLGPQVDATGYGMGGVGGSAGWVETGPGLAIGFTSPRVLLPEQTDPLDEAVEALELTPGAVRSSAMDVIKAHGTGNDFVVVLDLDDALDLPDDLVRALCDRRTGVGADGVIRIGAPRSGGRGVHGLPQRRRHRGRDVRQRRARRRQDRARPGPGRRARTTCSASTPATASSRSRSAAGADGTRGRGHRRHGAAALDPGGDPDRRSTRRPSSTSTSPPRRPGRRCRWATRTWSRVSTTSPPPR